MRKLKKQKGASLMEILVSITVLALGYTAVNYAALENTKHVTQLSSRQVALGLAGELVNELAVIGLTSVPAQGQREVVNGGRNYNLTFTVADHVTADVVDDATNLVVVAKQVTVDVSWSMGTENSSVRYQEILH
jgi:Tfp pilus assembly protein PilV